MKIYTSVIQCEFLSKDDIVLDIETTSLDSSGYIFLLGTIYFQEGHYHLTQFFVESASEERIMLLELIELIRNRKIISYNGKNFDVLYIRNRLIAHEISFCEDIFNHHFDLYRYIRSNIKYISLTGSLKLTAIEDYLNLIRIEETPGSEAAYYYKNYLQNKSLSIRPLLQHNRYDVINTEKAMIITDIISTAKTFQLDFEETLISVSVRSIERYKDRFKITLHLDNDLLEDFYFTHSHYIIQKHSQTLLVCLDVLDGYVSETDFSTVFVHDQKLIGNDRMEYDIPDHMIILEINDKYCMNNIKLLITAFIKAIYPLT